MVCIVNPVGDFPLNDDWAYVEAVKRLLIDHKFVMPDWSAANLFAQIIWGWIFSLAFGASFTALRFSVLALGLIGVIAVFKLGRASGAPIAVALLGAVLLMVNPLFFASSNTFMTDVPFFTFATLALLFLTKAINHDKTTDIVWGSIAVSLALLVRQLGFAIAIAYGLAYLPGRVLTIKTLFRAFAPLLVCIVLQLGFRIWLSSNDQLPSMYGHQITQIKEVLSLPLPDISKIFWEHVLHSSLYFCIFLSPLLLLALYYRNEELLVNRILLTIFIAIIAWLVLSKLGLPRWPLLANVMGKYGLGPMLQHGYVGYVASFNSAVKVFWKLIGVASIWFAGLTLWITYISCRNLLDSYKNKTIDLARIRMLILFVSVTLIYCMPTFLVPGLYDRYLLLPILSCGILIQLTIKAMPNFSKLRASIIILMVAFAGLITAMATHDYLAWNRVRWLALNYLIHEKGISPEKIDGGFEFNGMYLYSNDPALMHGSKGWWVVDNEYLISFSSEILTKSEGYHVEESYPVATYLPFSPDHIFVLHKK